MGPINGVVVKYGYGATERIPKTEHAYRLESKNLQILLKNIFLLFHSENRVCGAEISKKWAFKR